MSTRTDALVSQQETGKITASIAPCCGRLSLSEAITLERKRRSELAALLLAFREHRACAYILRFGKLQIVFGLLEIVALVGFRLSSVGHRLEPLCQARVMLRGL